MSQSFETTYKRYYRKHEIDRRHLLAPSDRFTEMLPKSGNWLIIKSLEEQQKSGLPLTEVENAVKAMYRKRLWSTYQLAYCNDQIPKEEYYIEPSENELVRLATELYSREDIPVLPTRPTARRVFGYLRPAYTYTPLTMYQVVHGQTAYRILKDGIPKNNTENNNLLRKDDKNTLAEMPNTPETTKPGTLRNEGEALKKSPGNHKCNTKANLYYCNCVN